jgi:hypothetical protein
MLLKDSRPHLNNLFISCFKKAPLTTTSPYHKSRPTANAIAVRVDSEEQERKLDGIARFQIKSTTIRLNNAQPLNDDP